MLEHCGEQQGANKQHMVETGPDMPDPGPEIFDKLVYEHDRMAFEPPSIVVGAEHRRMGSALLLEPQQAAVLWIQIEQKGVLTVRICGTAGQSAANRRTA